MKIAFSGAFEARHGAAVGGLYWWRGGSFVGQSTNNSRAVTPNSAGAMKTGTPSQLAYEPYSASVRRAPSQPFGSLPHTLSEVLGTGPVTGHSGEIGAREKTGGIG